MFAYMLEPPLTKYSWDPILAALMHYLPEIAIPLVDYSVFNKLWNAITGIPLSRSEFIKAGERIHVLERYMNTREGIDHTDDVLPDRLLKEGRTSDPYAKGVPLHKMLPRYYEVRGYDQNGIPTRETLAKLEIF